MTIDDKTLTSVIAAIKRRQYGAADGLTDKALMALAAALDQQRSWPGVTVNIDLPAEMKHTMAQKVNIPEIADLVDQFCRVTKDIITNLGAITKELKRSNDQNTAEIELLRHKIEDLTKAAKMDRQAVFDNDGNVIGSRAVNSLQ